MGSWFSEVPSEEQSVRVDSLQQTAGYLPLVSHQLPQIISGPNFAVTEGIDDSGVKLARLYKWISMPGTGSSGFKDPRMERIEIPCSPVQCMVHLGGDSGDDEDE
jgi:hypothetical protein